MLAMIGVATVIVAAVGCSSDGRELTPPEAPLPPGTILSGSASGDQPAETLVDGPLRTLPAEPLQLLAAWPDSAVLPLRHTCVDAGVSPALAWTVAPAGTAEMAISVTDLDADGTVHWLVEAIDPAAGAIAEGEVPPDAVVRMVDGSIVGWDPPCPPLGETHELLFTIYALPQQVELAADAPAAEVIAEYEAIALDRAAITASVQLSS